MQVSSQTNSYQDLSVHQKPTTIQPIPQEDKKPLEIGLSSEKKLANKSQEEKNQLRDSMVNQIEQQSKKTQVEIYLSVGDNDTIDSLNTLRDVQKQNNDVAAHATYKENQNNDMESNLGV